MEKLTIRGSLTLSIAGALVAGVAADSGFFYTSVAFVFFSTIFVCVAILGYLDSK